MSIKGKCIVLGPHGPLRNPNRPEPQIPKDEYAIDGLHGAGAKTRRPLPTEKKTTFSEEHVMDSYEMAVEVAKARAIQYPGQNYHILTTAAVYQSTVPEPSVIPFDNAI